MEQVTYDELFCNDNNTIFVRRNLAKVFGIEKGAILTQLESWINSARRNGDKRHFVDGQWWVWNTLDQWSEQMDYCSMRTLRRHLDWLKSNGIVIVRNDLNAKPYDRTYWYSIDYDILGEYYLAHSKKGKSDNSESRIKQPDAPDDHVDTLTTSKRTTCPDESGQSDHDNTIVSNIVSSNNHLNAKGSRSSDKSSDEVTVSKKNDFEISLQKTEQNIDALNLAEEHEECFKSLVEQFYCGEYILHNKVHHVLSKEQLLKAYAVIDCHEGMGQWDEDGLVWQIHRYLNDKGLSRHPSFEHFASKGILEIGNRVGITGTVRDEAFDYKELYLSDCPESIMNAKASDTSALQA